MFLMNNSMLKGNKTAAKSSVCFTTVASDESKAMKSTSKSKNMMTPTTCHATFRDLRIRSLLFSLSSAFLPMVTIVV